MLNKFVELHIVTFIRKNKALMMQMQFADLAFGQMAYLADEIL